jgi:hypothetical protein
MSSLQIIQMSRALFYNCVCRSLNGSGDSEVIKVGGYRLCRQICSWHRHWEFCCFPLQSYSGQVHQPPVKWMLRMKLDTVMM